MSDVYKFRVTVDLELATHESAKRVRDHLKALVGSWLQDQCEMPSHMDIDEVVEHIHKFNVRTKRLDDWASIDPPVTIRLAESKCPHCGTEFRDVVINRLPYTCPVCSKVIPLDADGRVR
jgi:predicted Zn-ribbon and HTH transcriptional regulator